MMLLLVIVEHTPICIIFIPSILQCVLKKLIEVASIERIKTHYRGNCFEGNKITVNLGSSYWALF